MLQLLLEYAQKHDLAPVPGFAKKGIHWLIECREDGSFVGVVPLGGRDEKRPMGREFRRCPYVHRTSDGAEASQFLWGDVQAVTFFKTTLDDPRVSPKHRYFVELLRDAASAMPQLARIADFLEDPKTLSDICGQLQDGKARFSEYITFRVGGEFVLDLLPLQEWWTVFRTGIVQQKAGRMSKKSRGVEVMRCLATGELVRPARTHPHVSGMRDVGGQARVALASFNFPSVCSFGLDQSFNAAVSEEAAYAYRDALNDLIDKRSKRLAGTKVVWWFKEAIPDEHDPLRFLTHDATDNELPALRRVRDLLDSIETGHLKDLGSNHYYALTVSGVQSRIMVRDWMEGQFEELVRNIDAWFQDLAIVDHDGGAIARTPGIERVITCLLPKKKQGQEYRDWIKPVGSERIALWRAAIKGGSIPHMVLAKALARARVDIVEDNPPSHARMGLLKAYHVCKQRFNGGDCSMTPYLNEDHPHPAYHCGRLMAVLAQLQRSALGDVGAGVVQRYYAAASSTPALVLGRLIRTGQFHLGKLEPGLAHWYEDKLAGICCRIKDGAPRTLDLEKQSLFALGYYQQLADLRTKKSDSSTGKTEESHA